MINKEEMTTTARCIYCGLEITNPRPNKYFHDASCCNMYYYWERYTEKKDGAKEVLEKLHHDGVIEKTVYDFILTLTPSAITDIVFSLGYRWHYTKWVKKYPEPLR